MLASSFSERHLSNLCLHKAVNCSVTLTISVGKCVSLLEVLLDLKGPTSKEKMSLVMSKT